MREKGEVLGEPALILVIVGTHFRGFERLVKKADELAGKMDEEFIIQIGLTTFRPKNSKFFRTIPYDRLLELMAQARVVVCHSGAGSILDCLSLGKMLIVVPRLKSLEEARDDHQLELAKLLEGQGKAVVVSDVEYLGQVIMGIEEPHERPVETRRPLVSALKHYLESLNGPVDGS